MSKASKKIKVKQIGSPIRRHHDQRETLIGLGLNRIGRVAELPDTDRKSTRLNSSHIQKSRMPSSA